MKRTGGYRDPLVFCHMSHFQEPTSKRYSLTERSFRIAWNRLTLPQILSSANLILVVTPLEKEAKARMGAKAHKCFLYPGGIDDNLPEFSSRISRDDVTDFLKQFGIDPDTKIVSYLGSLEERKNPQAMLKIAELLRDRKDIHFLIAGKGQTPYAQKLIQTARSLSNVTYVGEISENQKACLMKSSRVNVLLSRSEALGLTQLEFLYSGIPVVTSGVEGQAWLIRDGIEGVHVKGPDDVNGAAAAITELCDDQALWNTLSANATKRAKDLTALKLTERLDEALTQELIKERGLIAMPEEVRATIAEPENVLRSWSSGNWGVVATGVRLFIRKGRVSRKVIEIPYSNITSIEHTRRYPWRVLLGGSVISLILGIGLFANSIMPQTFALFMNELFTSTAIGLFTNALTRITLAVSTLIPLFTATAMFALEARTGFTLRGPGKEAIYLPGQFGEVIAFVRKIQDIDFEMEISNRKRRLQDFSDIADNLMDSLET